MTGRELGIVVVSGGASGLGAAVADAVSAAGGTPVVLDRRPPGSPVDHVLVDLSDTRAAEAAVREVVGRHGDVSGVVTAAGIDVPGPIDEVSGEDWDRTVLVNLLGTAAVARAAVPSLRRTGGRIVTVASTLAFRAVSHATAYCASKFGVVGFTRALAAELAGEVGVTMLVPGGMRTPFFDGHEERYRPAPTAMLNPPENVAAAVVFALSQPLGCEVRELVICPATEPTWP